MLPIRSILHPTDFSLPSEHAFRLACSLASDHGARLVVLHVVSTLLRDAPVRNLFLLCDEYREVLEERLHLQAAPDPMVLTEYRLKQGAPALQVLQVAEEVGCDLIVMGTHGRGAPERPGLGSVAEAVVRQAECAVLTVRTPHTNALPAWEAEHHWPTPAVG
jgi:nucleotide-binding universal stress UspA family protein